MQTNRFARKHCLQGEALRAGQGELHGLLSACGLDEAEFCALVGIDRSVFYRWYGHPLHKWPAVLLFHFGWAKNMANFLAARGWDPEKFRPLLPLPTTAGQYPRKAGDLKIVGVPAVDYSPWKVRK